MAVRQDRPGSGSWVGEDDTIPLRTTVSVLSIQDSPVRSKIIAEGERKEQEESREGELFEAKILLFCPHNYR